MGRRHLGLVLLAAWLGAGLVAGARPAPAPLPAQEQEPELDEHAAWEARLVDDGRRVDLEDRSGNDCLQCHGAIGEEWAHSTHATAWQDEHYQKALKKIRRKQGCTGCHAPEPLAAAGWPQKPKVRDEHRHLGVTCTSCHLAPDGETVLGPEGLANDAHASQASPLFDAGETNDLCIACHATNIGPVIGLAKDFVDTEQDELGNTCVGCHMPRVSRSWAEPWEEGQEPLPVRRGRSHRLQTPRDPLFLASAFELEAEATEGGAQLLLINLTGHRVPGVQGRLLRFELELLDGEGETVAEGARDFDYRAYLPVEDEVAVELEGRGVKLAVRGLHTPPDGREAQVFLERSFDL